MTNLNTELSGVALSDLHYNSGLDVPDFIDWLKSNYRVVQSDSDLTDPGPYYSVDILTDEGNPLHCYTYCDQYLPMLEEPNGLAVEWYVISGVYYD